MIDDMETRDFSSNTIASYVFRVAHLAKHFKKSPDMLDPEEIRE
jgi:integrase/recombinase XerD